MANIDRFVGRYHFLSNFCPSPLVWRRLDFPTVEHAYQWEKLIVPHEKLAVKLSATPGLAKRQGRLGSVRPGWNATRLQVMLDLLRIKFANPVFRHKLLATGDAELIESNNWNDTYWGVCNGKGENMLGKLLMQVRAEL